MNRKAHTHLRIGPGLQRKPGEYELKAPIDKYRAIGVDTKEDITADYLLGDFTSLRAAIEAARKRAGHRQPVFIYDHKGSLLAKFGSY